MNQKKAHPAESGVIFLDKEEQKINGLANKGGIRWKKLAGISLLSKNLISGYLR